MKILMFAASSRTESVNKKLIHLSSHVIDQTKHEIDLIDFAEFSVPAYDGDAEEKTGLPTGALIFIDKLKKHDCLIMASPEYNFGTPGTLKNLIDWVSRAKPIPWKDKPILLMAASPALAGGSRGLIQTQIPLSCCRAHVFPKMFTLPNAYEMFDDAGQLKDKALQKRLMSNIEDFLVFTNKIIRE